MKKVTKTVAVIIILLVGTVAANAQVKFGFGVGGAFPAGDGSDFLGAGFSAHAELGYGVTEDIDVSLLYQADFLIGTDTGGLDYGTLTISTFLANGRYFFRKSGFRPYGSLGLGFADIGSVSVDFDEDEDVEVNAFGGASNFAIRPAVGFKVGILDVNVAYLNAGKAGDTSISDITLNVGMLFTFGGK